MVSSKTSYVRIILTMLIAKRILCAANVLSVVACDLLRKPNQEAYETDVVSVVVTISRANLLNDLELFQKLAVKWCAS